MTRRKLFSALIALGLLAAAPVAAAAADADALAEPAAAVEAFSAALIKGDAAAASQLLDPAITIFESGWIERSRQEYAAHHMAEDTKFLRSATVTRLSRVGERIGDSAWIATEARITSSAGAKPVDIVSTETMVLHKTAAGWRIVHIHWSSRSAAKK